MFGRRIAWLFGFLVVALGAGGGALLWGLLQVPEFYEEVLVEQPDLNLRKQAAVEFEKRTNDLREELKHANMWSQEFTQAQVNAWLAEKLHTQFAELVPDGVRDPRVKFVDSMILVGFHYSDEKYSGIISLELKPWVIEPNRLAVEIRSIKAGAVPVPLEQFLDQIDEGLSQDGWHVESAQSNGNQVLVLRFIPSEANEPVLEAIHIATGKLQVAGSRGEAEPEPGPHTVKRDPTTTARVPNLSPRFADQTASGN